MKLLTKILINEFSQIRFYIFVIFAFAYSSLSLVNHYNYHTYAFDLGIYNNSIYQYGHFINNPHPFGHLTVNNFLGDHFALYTIIFSPLHYLFGTYTLLYIQIASILFGGAGIYKLVKSWYPNTLIPEIALFHFFSFYGIFSALSFDYHDNVVGTMLVPWFIYYVHVNKLKYATIMAFLIIIGKETLPLFLFSICLGLMVLYKKDKTRRTFSLILGLSSLVYGLIIINLVMPALVKQGVNASHVQYSVLGNNGNEVLESLFYKSKYLITALFCNVSNNALGNGVKEETYWCLLLSGGLCLFIRLEYALMLITVIVQKMLNDDGIKWGINYHYSVEFAPILILAFYSSLIYFDSITFKLAISLFFCLLTYSTTFTKMFIRTSYWHSEAQSNVFSKLHYTSYFNRGNVNAIIDMIPKDAKLSALSSFGPHVSFRPNIYMFPDINDANYIFVAEDPYGYPIGGPPLHNEIMKYKKSTDWQTITEINGIYLFKRIN